MTESNPKPLSAQIAESVRKRRKLGRLTQAELALLAGVGKSAVFDIERGKEAVQFDTLQKVLTTLNIRLLIESPVPLNNPKPNRPAK